MKKWLVHVLLVLMLCSLVLVLPTAAAVNGKIAFVSYRDGNSEIYMMNPDGTGQTRLTNNPLGILNPHGLRMVRRLHLFLIAMVIMRSIS